MSNRLPILTPAINRVTRLGQAAAATRTTAAATPAAGAAGAAAALLKLQHLLQGDSLTARQSATAVRLGKDVIKALGDNRSQQPPPRLAGAALEALSKAAEQAANPVHRGQLLLERSRLLQLMDRTAAAQEEVAAAVELFEAALAAWRASAATAAEAGVASTGDSAGQPAVPAGAATLPVTPRHVAATALAALLDVAAVLRQLGREERANALLADAVAVAPHLPSPASYLRAIAQMTEFTDEQLGGVLDCQAAAEQGSAARRCSWMRLNSGGTAGSEGKPAADLHRLYYAAHRGLHARQRYREAWQALAQAKRLHFGNHTHAQKDYSALIADMERLFPAAAGAAGAQATQARSAGSSHATQGGATASQPAQGKGSSQAASEDTAGVAGGAHAQAPAPASLQQCASELAAQALLQVQRAAASSAAWLLRRLSSLSSQLGLSARMPDRSAVEAGEAAEGGKEGSASGGRVATKEMRPIFVLGLPRSGSTLIEQILASHPDVWGAGEHSALRPVAKRLQELLEASGTVDASALQQLRQRYLQGMRSKVPVERQLTSSWLVDKALANAELVGHIAMLLPEACLVHAVRHPADAALSAYQQAFFPKKVPWSFNLTDIAAHMAAHHRLMAHWDRVLPGRVLHMHYSHMVADQEGSTRRILQHCGLPWHPAVLRFYATERSVQTASQLQVKKPIYNSSLNKWHTYRQGLAPLLLELRNLILWYEEEAGLPSSALLLDELAAEEQQVAAAAAAAAANAGSGTAEAEQGAAADTAAWQQVAGGAPAGQLAAAEERASGGTSQDAAANEPVEAETAVRDALLGTGTAEETLEAAAAQTGTGLPSVAADVAAAAAAAAAPQPLVHEEL